METNRPLILISNDDGVSAPGMRYLIESVRDMGEIIAVAPDGPRSGQSSAITVDSPLRITRHDDYCGAAIYSVNGTPVDCIKLGMHAIVPRRPDLVLSGINHGSNSGNSIIYSGTMGAVMEACFLGIPAIGYSLLHHSWKADFSQCGPIIRHITSQVLQSGLPSETCLNVNIPARCTPKGIKVVNAAKGYWTEEYAQYTDPHGRPYFWLTGRFNNTEPDNPDTDHYWLDRQYATVVPVRPDQTNRESISAITHLLNL